ncbi:DUF2591 family hypothetical protein [Aeromonas phage Gekk3-15]
MIEFVEVKTAELSDSALDWAVAQVIGVNCTPPTIKKYFRPSTCWADGGILWEQFATSMDYCDGWLVSVSGKIENGYSINGSAKGGSKLIALCRAIVDARFGPSIKVPVELLA